MFLDVDIAQDIASNHLGNRPPALMSQNIPCPQVHKIGSSPFSITPTHPLSTDYNKVQHSHTAQMPLQQQSSEYSHPPPFLSIPDLSKPPPGFLQPNNAQQQTISNQIPEIVEEVKPMSSYFDLPAGLMVPLIRLEDYKYHPLDSEELRLPPPTPPNERLISAVEAFYSLPSHDRPRDG